MIWVAGWYVIASAISFAMYRIDKARARRSRYRIKEASLHGIDLLGGWPGGFAAQRLLHHKSSKVAFLRVFWATVVLHLMVWSWILYRCLR